MNLKFLIPNWKKVVLFLVLSFVFIPFLNYDNGTRCITTPCNTDTTGSVFMYLLSYHGMIYYISWVNLIAGLIFLYFISCLIFELGRKKK